MDPPDYLLPNDQLTGQKVELIKGEKEDSVWLILNNKFVLHKNRLFKNGNIVWECKFRRVLNCPFKLETEKEINIIWMYNPSTHTCDVDPIEIIVHKFKLEVKKKMCSDFRAKYNTVYNTVKKQFLDEIEDDEFRQLVSFQLPSMVSFQKHMILFVINNIVKLMFVGFWQGFDNILIPIFDDMIYFILKLFKCNYSFSYISNSDMA